MARMLVIKANMKILVMFTGGTIGSCLQDGYISPDEDNNYKLINMYREKTGDTQEFDLSEPYTTLSENLNGTHLQMLIREVANQIEADKYDGIIVTHGTDTLQYSAAALSIMFDKVEIPIILVSSNYPLEDERANGVSNFEGAVKYIQNKGEAGVYVSYVNADSESEDESIFSAENLANHDMYSDNIRLVNIKTIKTKFDVKINPKHIEINEKSNILFIKPYPGISYNYNLDNVRVVLFGSYHSGTIATSDIQLSEFCKKVRDKGIPMYIAGMPEGAGYESTKYYNELGIEVLPLGTDIYWYMKIWLSE